MFLLFLYFDFSISRFSPFYFSLFLMIFNRWIVHVGLCRCCSDVMLKYIYIFCWKQIEVSINKIIFNCCTNTLCQWHTNVLKCLIWTKRIFIRKSKRFNNIGEANTSRNKFNILTVFKGKFIANAPLSRIYKRVHENLKLTSKK